MLSLNNLLTCDVNAYGNNTIQYFIGTNAFTINGNDGMDKQFTW